MNDVHVSFRRLALITAACLALSVIFFSPRLWLMRDYVKGSFQWDRAQTFLQQCEQPMRRDIEPAMHWRLLPPLVCHALHLPGKTALAVPWLGIMAATGYVAVLFRRRHDDWRFVTGGTLLFATTSAVLVPVGWLGINDAWVWLGLLSVAFRNRSWTGPIACLLCPWIDERFIIGFPLAWIVKRSDRGGDGSPPSVFEALWLLPYASLRLWLTRHDPAASEVTHQFLATHVRQAATLLPLAPLGWWMGLRAAWLAVGYAGFTAPKNLRWFGAATLLTTAGVSFVLAADLSRSIAVLIPVVLLGCFAYAERERARAPRVMLAVGLLNLFIPAAHVVAQKIDPISPLPFELIRWYRMEAPHE